MWLAEFLALFDLLDAIALAVLVLSWGAIGWIIERPGQKRRSVASLMSDYRKEWMYQLLDRDMRIFDASLVQNLRDGTAFFASTCLLAIGGVLALMGNVEPLRDLPGTDRPEVLYQAKLVLVVLLLTNGFLKFVWANRLFGYFSVLIGAIPNKADDPVAKHRAEQAAILNVRGAVNFNRGLRSIYFALAALAWLLGPIALMVATAVTLWMLYEREFLSQPRKILADRPPK